ncbi:hypothetical protein OH77DRAFT_1250510 [Trametes cingulata]|nr:hypothetical protein OH77DRAFT_1250510 [Trametes cingulata]
MLMLLTYWHALAPSARPTHAVHGACRNSPRASIAPAAPSDVPGTGVARLAALGLIVSKPTFVVCLCSARSQRACSPCRVREPCFCTALLACILICSAGKLRSTRLTRSRGYLAPNCIGLTPRPRCLHNQGARQASWRASPSSSLSAASAFSMCFSFRARLDHQDGRAHMERISYRWREHYQRRMHRAAHAARDV